MNPLITVITPTYNRAHLLPRLYESLCRQTFRDFEWIVVDDGSTDDTNDVLTRLSAECDHNVQSSKFKVQVYRKENGGKHTAVNFGVKHAKGELVFIADADDALPKDALQIVAEQWKEVRENPYVAGVCGLDELMGNGSVVLGRTNFTTIDCTYMDFWYKYKFAEGDMKEVWRTSVLRAYPYPEIPGERFCPEVLVWSYISHKYKLHYFNHVIYSAEYQPDGLSANIIRVRMKSPIASMMTYAECISYPYMSLADKIRQAINYWRFRCCYRKTKENRLVEVPSLSTKWLWTAPLGWLMHINDLRKINR